MFILNENQLTVSKDDPKKLLKYAIRKIHIESNSMIKVFIRDDVNFNRIVDALKEIYGIKNTRPKFPDVPFTTKCYKNTKSFVFEKDIKGVVALLFSMNAMSEVTFEKFLSHLKTNDNLQKKQVKTLSR